MNSHVNFKAETQTPSSVESTILKASPSRIIRIKEVIRLTGLSRATIYDRMDPKSLRHDPSFPKQFNLGGNSKRATAVGWREAEVLAWIEQCQQGALEQEVEVSNPAIH